MRRILRILELRYDREPLGLVREHLLEPRRRANSIEVLDTLLDPSLRPLVMPFLDDIPVAERLRHAAALIPPAPEPVAFLRQHCRHPNPYVAMVALDALARHGAAATAEEAVPALGHREPLVREAALHALAMVLGAAAAAAGPAAHRRSRSRRGAPRRGDPGAPRRRCRSRRSRCTRRVEKVLFLKSAPVFARLSGEDLAPLARMAEVLVRARRGERIFTEGEMGDALYVVVRGSVAILRGGTTLALLGAGEAFGEMAVLDEVPRSATAEAAEEIGGAADRQ